jgi:hypothetical protein
MPDSALKAEAGRFAHYLLNKKPQDWVIQLYVNAVKKRVASSDPGEQQLFDFAAKHGWSIGLIDSGLALTRPESEFRMRILLMFAILETDPICCNIFLPKKRNRFYLLAIVFHSARAFLKAIAGSLFVKLIG